MHCQGGNQRYLRPCHTCEAPRRRSWLLFLTRPRPDCCASFRSKLKNRQRSFSISSSVSNAQMNANLTKSQGKQKKIMASQDYECIWNILQTDAVCNIHWWQMHLSFQAGNICRDEWPEFFFSWNKQEIQDLLCHNDRRTFYLWQETATVLRATFLRQGSRQHRELTAKSQNSLITHHPTSFPNCW